MAKSGSSGFVLGELLAVMSLVTTLCTVVKAAEPSLDRVCVGTAPGADGPQPAGLISEVEHWACVAVSSAGAGEYRYAAAPPP